jgi:ABC-type transport system involved in cytochrome c biogenesis permease subunit
MKRWLDALGSLKLTVALIIVLGGVLARGTIEESLHGADAARAIYYSSWFFGLQGLFASNVVAALLTRWPRTRLRIGFAVTHLALVVIFAGAVLTYLFKIEGQVPLWEGESAGAITQGTGDGRTTEVALPFRLRLDAFEIDTYPGTRRPAMFRSRVTVLDPARGRTVPGVIQMNRPLAYGGFRFFQSSYRTEDGREMSVLSAARDPGQPVVFVGYALLVGGMIVVFGTRLAVARRRIVGPAADEVPQRVGPAASAARTRARPRVKTKTAAAVLLGILAAAAGQAAHVPDAAVVARLRGLAVQHDGRTMPFETQAREAVWKVTGLRAWPGIDPVAMAAGWSFDAGGWMGQPVVKVGDRALAEAIGLPSGTRWASYETLEGSSALQELTRRAFAQQEAEVKLSSLEKHALALYERLQVLDEAFRGAAILAVPAAGSNDAWSPAPVSDAAGLAAFGERLRAGEVPPHYPSAAAIRRELRYDAARPTRLAWLLLLPAAVAAALTQARDRFRLRLLAGAGVALGFAAMTWGLAVRWQIAGRIPASNMYESMLFLGWGVGLFGVVALLLRQRLLVANAAGMGALAMMLADLLPIDGFIHPVAPVLAGTPWLAIHVPIIVVSYSVLAMATGLAHLVLGAAIFAPARRDLTERWSQLLYWYLHVGSILLIAGILTGSIWAASSWGRYWGWDPKEVWSLVAFLAYMAILHARFDGQVRSFGVAAWSILAFWTILMTYLGVNFVLASGLHAYGFGSSNLVTVMLVIAAGEGAFVLAAWNAHRRRLVAATQAA